MCIRDRLNAAAAALRAGDDTVLAIAESCGFENLSYFNRMFKRRFGLTPVSYTHLDVYKRQALS